MHNPLGGGNAMYVHVHVPIFRPTVTRLLTLLSILILRVPHYSGTTLDAQARYASGTKAIIENFFNDTPQNPYDVIVSGGTYATRSYGQRAST